MTAKDRDDPDRAEAEMAAAGIPPKTHVDPDLARAYNEYLKDWRQRMHTWSVY